MKHLNKILLLFSAFLLLSGCGSSLQIKEKAIVQSVGIDVKNKSYDVTMQIFSFDGAEGQKNYEIINGSGETLTDALSDATLKSGKIVFFGNNKVIVVGYDTAKESIEEILNFFNNNHQSSVKTPIAVAYNTANEIITAQKDKDTPISGEEISMILKRSSEGGFAPSANVATSLSGENSGSGVGYLLPIIREEEKEESSELSIWGSAVMSGNMLSTIISSEESRGINWLTNDKIRTVISVDNHDEKVTAMVSKSDYSIKSSVISGTAVYDMKLDISCTIDVNPIPKQSEIEKISELIEQTIHREIETAINKTAYEEGLDLLLLKEYMSKNNYHFIEENEEIWQEVTENAEFFLEINVEIV